MPWWLECGGMESVPKYERLMNLVAYLLKGQAPTPWSRICGRVVGYDDEADRGSIKRRFERDKDELRAMGIPIRFVPITESQDEGYAIVREECFLGPMSITSEEAIALSCLSNIGGRKEADPLLASARSALLKLRASTPGAFAGDERDALLVDTGGLRGEDAARLQELRRAILARKAVRFNYRSLSEKRVRERKVDPYGMALFEGRWYLVGRAHDRDALRVWNAERISGRVKQLRAEGQGADFEPPKDFRVEDYIGVPGWLLYRGEKRTAAKIWFHADIAWMIAESAAGESEAGRQRFKLKGDGCGVLEVFEADPRALVLWTLKFKEKARILEPPELRALARKVLSDMRKSL